MSKVLFIHPNNDFTGSTRVLANILEGRKEPVTVICRNYLEGCLSSLPNVRIISPSKFTIRNRPIPIISAIMWRLHFAYKTLVEGYKYDTFYINTIMPYFSVMIGVLMGKKIIFHVHEKFVNLSFETRIAEYVFNHVKAKRIYVSNYLKKQYKDNPQCSSIVDYNKLSKAFIEKITITPIECRSRSNISMFCSLTKAKGVDTFVELAKILPQYHFILVVSTNIKAINSYFSTSIPDNLEIIPYQSDVSEILQRTDLMLNLSLPSLWIETFGMTILEAMAYAIPAIVPNVGGPLELVDYGKNGYTVDTSVLDEISVSIKRALSENNYQELCIGAIRKFNELNGIN